MLQGMFRWLSESDPSAADMTTLLKEIDAVLESLGKKLDSTSLQDKSLLAVKAIYEPAKAALPLATQGVDPTAWDKKGREERARLFAEFTAVKRSLVGLDFPEIREGIRTFWVLAAAFVVAVGLYMVLHLEFPAQTDAAVAEQTGITSSTTAAGASNPPAPPSAQRTIETEELLTVLRLQLGKATPAWNDIASTREALTSRLAKDTLSFRTMKALGTLEGTIKQKDVAEAKTALGDLDVLVTEDVSDPPASYLWTSGAKKWGEIAFWALFGVLVGLMYYVSKRLKQGLFDRQDIATMAAEALAAPVVACVVFFLVNKTGIIDVSPSSESVLVVLGVAFILGYAIRRTIGILDSLKTRILPDPK